MLTRRALVLAPAALAAAATPVRLPRRLRVGILGLDGHTAEIVDQIPRLPDVEIVAVSDADSKALSKFMEKPALAKAKPFADARQMLDGEKLDLVAVCNNNGERAAAILDCIRRKLDVIAEKPFALTTADLDKIKAAAAANRTKLGMLLPMRFDPPYLALHQIVKEGLIGEVAQISSQKSYKAGVRAPWYLKRATYGGTIAWIGIHMIDLMRFTSGREFQEVLGMQTHVGFPDLGEMENVTASIFKLDNGGIANLRMDYLRTDPAATHGDDRLRLAGTKGIAEYQASTGVTLMTSSQKPHVVEPLPEQQSVFLDFLDSAYNGRPASLTLADMYRVTEITIAAQKAADQGHLVRI
ncbi:MAG: Gfo/Idh/MocA family oxidoreductase [Bryobacteraceae bacterium]